MGPEAAFVEAAHQLQRRSTGGDTWSSRAVFWTAVRFGSTGLCADGWVAASERWTALWEIAAREHLAPIPGAPEVGAPPSVAAAEQGLAQMRAIVGERAKHVHR